MQRKINALTAVVITIGLLMTSTALSAGEIVPADGAALWKHITQDKPYTNWDLWPGHTGIQKGTPNHSAYIQVFLNKPALEAAKASKVMPVGSIIVKENYGPDKKTLIAVTSMYKIEDYNPPGGDWFWTKYNPDGIVEKEGRINRCIECHRVAKDTNWIFSEVK